MTNSTITREQLIEKLKHGIAVTEKYPHLEEAQIDSQIFKIALAAMDSEPVMFCSEETLAAARDGEHLLRTLSSPSGECVIPLYRHAQQTVVPQELTREMYLEYFMREDWRDSFRSGWEAHYAAALKAGNSPVIPEGWQVEAEKLAEIYGMSFVLFRHGEAPQCADPTKVVISFTDKGLGHDTLPAAPQELK
ncbi:hypothetical protein [Klebsiella oxytoca]|uniref:hypothetical protein n=1 Tax=Klebsiella oxytoca TaxID=571 RepID=UPI0021B0E97E|nr:hypothetical protein [Klebsiella oxytoca]